MRHHFEDHALVARVRTVHAVHHIAFGRVDACISQVTHNAHTRYSIWDGNAGGEEKREVSRLFGLGRLVVDPSSDSSRSVVLLYFARSSGSPAAAVFLKRFFGVWFLLVPGS